MKKKLSKFLEEILYEEINHKANTSNMVFLQCSMPPQEVGMQNHLLNKCADGGAPSVAQSGMRSSMDPKVDLILSWGFEGFWASQVIASRTENVKVVVRQSCTVAQCCWELLYHATTGFWSNFLIETWIWCSWSPNEEKHRIISWVLWIKIILLNFVQ